MRQDHRRQTLYIAALALCGGAALTLCALRLYLAPPAGFPWLEALTLAVLCVLAGTCPSTSPRARPWTSALCRWWPACSPSGRRSRWCCMRCAALPPFCRTPKPAAIIGPCCTPPQGAVQHREHPVFHLAGRACVPAHCTPRRLYRRPELAGGGGGGRVCLHGHFRQPGIFHPVLSGGGAGGPSAACCARTWRASCPTWSARSPWAFW